MKRTDERSRLEICVSGRVLVQVCLRDSQIVILERVVLIRVEHFKQCSAGVTVRGAAAELVDLVAAQNVSELEGAGVKRTEG